MRIRGERAIPWLAFASAFLGSLLKIWYDPGSPGLLARIFQMPMYSDIVPLFYARGIEAGVVPYLEPFEGQYLEYPVITGAIVRITQLLAEGGLGPLNATGVFSIANWALMALFAAITAYAIVHFVGRGPALAFALSPLLFLEAGINWDLPAVASIALALLAWQRRRANTAALLIGLGTAAKLFPALLLPILVLDGLRHRRRGEALRVAVIALATWIVVNLPVALANREGWWYFYSFSKERGRDWGSVWLSLEYLGVTLPSTAGINLISSMIMAIVLLVVAYLMWRNDLSVMLAAATMVTAFTVVGKVYSPQYSLWLLLLVLLLRPGRRILGTWTVVHVCYWIAIWWHLLWVRSDHLEGLSGVPYAVITLLMHASTLWVVALAYRQETRSARVVV